MVWKWQWMEREAEIRIGGKKTTGEGRQRGNKRKIDH